MFIPVVISRWDGFGLIDPEILTTFGKHGKLICLSSKTTIFEGLGPNGRQIPPFHGTTILMVNFFS